MFATRRVLPGFGTREAAVALRGATARPRLGVQESNRLHIPSTALLTCEQLGTREILHIFAISAKGGK